MAVVAMLATTIPSILYALLARDGDAPARWERVAGVAELNDQEVVYVPRWGLFLVAEPQGPIALYARNPARQERVLFCPSSEHFEGERGDVFDRRGVVVSGSAERGLARFDVRVRDGAIEVDVDRVFLGPRHGTASALSASGPHCAGAVEVEPGFWGEPRSRSA